MDELVLVPTNYFLLESKCIPRQRLGRRYGKIHRIYAAHFCLAPVNRFLDKRRRSMPRYGWVPFVSVQASARCIRQDWKRERRVTLVADDVSSAASFLGGSFLLC